MMNCIKSFSEYCENAGNTDELLRDRLLMQGESAAIVYPTGRMNAELFAIQTALSLASGKPFGGLIPARQLKVLLCGAESSTSGIGDLGKYLLQNFTREGWTEDDLSRAMQETRLFLCDFGKVGAAYCDALETELSKTEGTEDDPDIVILCDAVVTFGDDTDDSKTISFSSFLQSHLRKAVKGRAVLALIKTDNKDDTMNRLIRRCCDIEIKSEVELDRDLLNSPRGRAVSEWAKRIFVLSPSSKTTRRILTILRDDGRSLWASAAYGRGALGHAVTEKDDHFEEIHLDQIQSEKERKILAESVSCADTLSAELRKE